MTTRSNYRVTNPATGLVEAEFPEATDDEIAQALTRSHEAFRTWSVCDLATRVDVIRRVADLHAERRDLLADLIVREMGKTTADARAEVDQAVAIYRYYAEHGPRHLRDKPLPTTAGGTAWLRKAPIGPLLGIMPWNYPYYQVARFAGPNLIVGNTIVLKHAPQCPESSRAMEEIFHDAELLPDAYINIYASDSQVAAMIADPRIVGVSVTGSERAGAAVAAVAGQHLKKVVLELGGSDPFIVLSATDIAQVAKEAADARMANAGQACNSAKRMIVMDSIYEPFASALAEAMAAKRTGDPRDPQTDFGPLSSLRAADTLIAQIDDAVAKGATVLTGGKRLPGPGVFVEPTVLTDVTPEMRAFSEELFGPAAVVYRVQSRDEAIELANSSPYGLGAAIYSCDEAEALATADRIDSGMVWINSPEGGGPDLPFGGTKRSGIGRELGPLGIDEFVNKKLIHTP